ncbi:MAG: DUF2089 family protein [Phycisphaerales bacterium]|nr:DUF2089 family protein [Phycisphaerales bacterium]
MTKPEHSRSPLFALDESDLEFITRFVLASGSLKDVAAEYSVSYPTIRARLDQIIERLRAIVAGRKPDPMSELLARLLERGEISSGAAKQVQRAWREHRDSQ